MLDTDDQKLTLFKSQDVRLLRERLCWVMKKSPPHIQAQINDTLLRFAKSVSEYCRCEDRSYVAAENKYACLNCGKRTSLTNLKIEK